MRIKSVCLTWFRGAADPVALEANGKSMVIYGQNGAGKSSFVDAIEYVINDGKLKHLKHEYSGRHQEKGIRNTHASAEQNTEFWIRFQDDNELNVKIAPTGSHIKAGAEDIAMDTWDYRRMILRQDEVAEFIHSTKGEKYSTLLPLFGLHELEIAAENLRQLTRVVEQRSELAQKQGAFGHITSVREETFANDSDEVIEQKISSLHKKYCPRSEITETLTRCEELRTALTERITKLSVEDQRHLALQRIANAKLTETIKAIRNANSKLVESVEPLITEKLEVLESTDAFVAQLEDTGDVLCPACGRSIPVMQFKAHVKAEQGRLKEVTAIFWQRKVAINKFIDTLKSIKSTLATAEIKAWREKMKGEPLENNINWVGQCDVDEFRKSLNEGNLKTIEDNCLPIIQAAGEAAQDAPPSNIDLVDDKTLVEMAKTVVESGKLAKEISRIERLIKFINFVEKGVREEILERSEVVIKEISNDISTMWTTLHPAEPIEDIHFYLPAGDKAIDIALKFHGKDQDSPRLTLSEGYRNSLGLCIFLAMAKHEMGNDRPLILDDVVVSFDRNHRGMVVELLEDEFAKRQVIIFTHDRDWYTELRQQLDERRWEFKALLPYETPTLGIRWSDKRTTFDDARASLEKRPDSAGNDARKIMDIELAIAAEQLRMYLLYMRGDKNDKRVAHDFLERLIADGKRCFQKKEGENYVCHAEALDLLERADRLLVSWGNKSSHSFDVMRAEASTLIDACEQALDVFRCEECGKHLWFADADGPKWVQCQCSKLRWRYSKG